MGKIFYIFIILLFFQTHAYAETKLFTVAGTSMLPTLKPSDRIMVDTSYYDSNPLKRFDLVAIDFSTRDRPMVKRVIAIPGDSITFKDYNIIISWKSSDCPGCTTTKQISQRAGKILSIQLKRYNNFVPEGCLIVLGDNHENTFDSADYGFISMKQVLGKVLSE